MAEAWDLHSPFTVGTPVRVKKGWRKGQRGRVVQVLTPPTCDEFITGMCNFEVEIEATVVEGVAFDAIRLDYRRHELVRASRERKPRRAPPPSGKAQGA